MDKIKTVHILALLTMVDMIWGSGGGTGFALWFFYGIYKLLTRD